jgi:hypothetical protein
VKQPSVSRFVFILAPLLSIPFILKDIYDKKKIGLIMLAVFFGVCAYLYLPDVLQDGGRRYRLYENFQNRSLEGFFEGYLAFRSDYIFYILIYGFAVLNIKFQLLLFLFAVFNVGVPLYIFDKVIDKFKLSKKDYFLTVLLIICSLSLTYIFSGVRQLVAFNFILLSTYHYFFNKKIMISLLFALLGMLTHFSVFIFLPLMYIVSRFNVKILTSIIFIFFIIGFIFPDTLIQGLFLSIDTDSSIYNNKIEGYSATTILQETTTLATASAKVLKQLWFYIALLYALISPRKHTVLFKIFLLVLLPISLLITFPGIAGRYIDLLKMVFALVVIDDYLEKRSNWLIIFLLLFSFAPLYDVFRLLTSSLKWIYTLDHFSLVQIVFEKYTYQDVVNISN